MASRMLIVGSAAVGCLTAAGLGGYLAVRTAMHTSEASALPDARAVTHTVDAAPPPSQELAPVPTEPIDLEVEAIDTPPVTPVLATASVPRHPGRVTRPASDAGPHTTGSSRPVTAATRSTDIAEPPAVAPAVAPVAVLAGLPSSTTTLPVYPHSTVSLPEPRFDVLEIPANAVIGIRLDTTISSETAAIEDDVRALVSRPVLVDGVTVIPIGTALHGSVTHVERGGKIREHSRIGIRFTSVVLDNGLRVPIRTDTIFREGEPPAGEATAKIGASAVIGSILGGVFGGRKGAAIGGAAGAAGGTAMVVAGDRNEATMPSGSALTVRLSEAASIQVER